jgi:Asp-tRNA(Asn)/Glu-tRNA(Gln) amidotransferase A subunit family amidase
VIPAAARKDGHDLSFVTIRELGRRLRAGEISSVELTQHCLDQLVTHDPVLNCVVTITKDMAMRQAEQADRELRSGHDRGPLHGIPWGAKDLIGVAGYATTWGAPQFRDQHTKTTATVAKKLEDAGAVLAAKLSLGALAMGDQWFNGQTKNPWNPEQGSSGSSAGSASAVAAGLLPFAIGSETLGSIISPTRRCGIAGLRPTFGRVSRTGCMALSWTMDKIGPIARSADDLASVFHAIHGRDPADPTTVDRWFQWPVSPDWSKLRVGRVTNCDTAPPDQTALDILKELGANIVDIELPRDIPEWALASMLDVEAASAFCELTRSSNLDGINAWSDIFRASHFVSAVDFLQASRARYELMKKMVAVFKKADIYVGGNDLGITNLTGHPSMALPVAMADMKPQTRPLCCTLTAGLHDEATLLAVALQIELKADVLKYRPQLR